MVTSLHRSCWMRKSLISKPCEPSVNTSRIRLSSMTCLNNRLEALASMWRIGLPIDIVERILQAQPPDLRDLLGFSTSGRTRNRGEHHQCLTFLRDFHHLFRFFAHEIFRSNHRTILSTNVSIVTFVFGQNFFVIILNRWSKEKSSAISISTNLPFIEQTVQITIIVITRILVQMSFLPLKSVVSVEIRHLE